jgi:hypothetical protein
MWIVGQRLELVNSKSIKRLYNMTARSKMPLMKVEVFSPGLLVYLPKWQDRQISLLTC